MFLIRRVHGTSMEPTYTEGAFLFAIKWGRTVREGDVVIAYIDQHEVVKRIDAIHKDRRTINLKSDNVFGSSYQDVDRSRIKGRVICSIF